jgi:hypothetical protein
VSDNTCSHTLSIVSKKKNTFAVSFLYAVFTNMSLDHISLNTRRVREMQTCVLPLQLVLFLKGELPVHDLLTDAIDFRSDCGLPQSRRRTRSAARLARPALLTPR